MGLGGFLQSVFANNAPKQQPIPQPTDVTGPYDNQQSYDPYAPEPSPAMDAYYNEVTNMPVRRGPSKLRMLGTGLLSALQGSTGEESRVPLRNAAGKVVGSREAGFLESLGNKPFNVGQANAILDMPYEAAVEDWKLRSEGLGKAANIEKTAESNRALAAQRYAQAQATPVRAAATAQNAETNRQKLELQQYLKDLPDSEKYKLLQEGKVSIADIQAAAAQKRVETQQTGATQRTGMQQEGATTRTGMQQEGATERTGMQQTGAAQRNETRGWKVGTIPDPSDPTKQIGVRYNEITGAVEPVTMGGQPTGPITRPGIAKPGGETPAEVARMQGVRSMAEQTTGALQELITPEGKLQDDVKWAVGGSKYASMIPGTAAASGAVKIKRAKDLLTLQLIGEMKAQSRTGATGFGQMNIKELGVLESAASKLDPNMKEEDFEKEIHRILPLLNKIQQASSQTIKVPSSTEGTPNVPKAGTRRTVKTPQGNRVQVATGNPSSPWRWE